MIRPPPKSPLFPSPPLFRSRRALEASGPRQSGARGVKAVNRGVANPRDWKPAENLPLAVDALRSARSEEHTSELQSRLHLVCRLLLEKKKKKKKYRRVQTQ